MVIHEIVFQITESTFPKSVGRLKVSTGLSPYYLSLLMIVWALQVFQNFSCWTSLTKTLKPYNDRSGNAERPQDLNFIKIKVRRLKIVEDLLSSSHSRLRCTTDNFWSPSQSLKLIRRWRWSQCELRPRGSLLVQDWMSAARLERLNEELKTFYNFYLI